MMTTETTTTEATPVAAVKKAPVKKAVKKVAKKAPVEKAAPAAKEAPAPAKKATKKTVTTIVAPKAPKDGLRKPQIRILQVLAKGKALTRGQISEKAPVDNAFCTEYMGSLNEEVRAKNDAKYPCLLTLKFIKAETHDIDGKDTVMYSITAAGTAGLAKALKAAAE